MIWDFSVRNFGPYKERVTLSMLRTRFNYPADTIVHEKNDVMTSALVFGANAAGKSYLVQAVLALRRIVDKTYTDTESNPWYMPFRLSKESLESPVELRIRLTIDGILYDYSVSFGSNTVQSESLSYWPKGRRVRVFDRRGPEEFVHGTKSIIDRTNTSSSYVAVASNFNDKVCTDFRRALINGIIVLNRDVDLMVSRSYDFLSRDPEKQRYAIDALRIADLGISGFSSEERALPDDFSIRDFHELGSVRVRDGKPTFLEVKLKHDLETDGVGEEQTVFPMSIESSGTQAMFGMIGPLVDAMIKGKTIIIDEFGSYMHTALSSWIIAQFVNTANPNHAQLIANTHDVLLMDQQEILRRDQIWFVNRNRRTGVSDLYCMADFKGNTRFKSASGEYLSGRFDAVPEIRARNIMERQG